MCWVLCCSRISVCLSQCVCVCVCECIVCLFVSGCNTVCVMLQLNGSLRSCCCCCCCWFATCVSIFHEQLHAALRCTAMAMVVQQIELIQENGIIKRQERAASALDNRDGNKRAGAEYKALYKWCCRVARKRLRFTWPPVLAKCINEGSPSKLSLESADPVPSAAPPSPFATPSSLLPLLIPFPMHNFVRFPFSRFLFSFLRYFFS